MTAAALLLVVVDGLGLAAGGLLVLVELFMAGADGGSDPGLEELWGRATAAAICDPLWKS